MIERSTCNPSGAPVTLPHIRLARLEAEHFHREVHHHRMNQVQLGTNSLTVENWAVASRFPPPGFEIRFAPGLKTLFRT